jgi:hypothetical protein
MIPPWNASVAIAATDIERRETLDNLFRIAFMEMRCLEETSEISASDEPYALFFTADLHGSAPKAAMFRTKVFEDTDQDELKKQWVRIWGVNEQARPITDPNKVIILVALMENDESSPDDIVTATRPLMAGNLLTLASSGTSRSKMVSELIKSFKSGINLGSLPGIPNEDDRIGEPQELRITSADLAAAKKSTIRRNLTFSGDGGKYRLGFDIAAGPG